MGLTNPSGPTMSIVAHTDDELLFQNPDIATTIAAGGAHTTVFLTAGDAGHGLGYVMNREAGAKAAYSYMAGHSEWVDTAIAFTDGAHVFPVHMSYLQARPEIRLYFLRLPDGGFQGGGFEANDFQSLEKLWEGQIRTITPLDHTQSYTADQLSGLLLGLMEFHRPATLLLQDPNSVFAAADHSDHYHGALFAYAAQQRFGAEHSVISYIDYATAGLAANLDANSALHARETFNEYVRASRSIATGYDQNGTPMLPASYQLWLDRIYRNEDIGQLDSGALWLADFGNAAGGWSNSIHIRSLGDTNGDGLADIVGFGTSGVFTALSEGDGFGRGTFVYGNFGYGTGGWRIGLHGREIADVNGDGLVDIVGFGSGDTVVALADGSGDFRGIARWSDDFGLDDGWSPESHQRALGDVNGDGRADIVGFGQDGVTVALSTGAGFAPGRPWIADFGTAQGWHVGEHLRVLADVDGDGMADIVGFGYSQVIVATSTGSGFSPIEFWSSAFTSRAGWHAGTHERAVADVNGDGLADLVGFGADGVFVALSRGDGFGAPRMWSDQFGNNTGWSRQDDVRRLADVNGDGLADIVAFGNDGVRVLLSDGNGFVSLGSGAAKLTAMQLVEDYSRFGTAFNWPGDIPGIGGL